ncbi:MAG: hypothetical protein RBU37_07490 [Myxococcota bacterium]|nr:hypothetical protein [Myxococcota bacterium]
MIWPEQYELLRTIVWQMNSHRERLAKQGLSRLVLARVDSSTSNPELLSHIIAESLLKRVDRALHESKNIYVERFEIPQIRLFYQLMRAIPFIEAAHDAANQCFLEHHRGEPELCLLDIGIGQGHQMMRLLTQLDLQPSPPKRVRLVGIDPGILDPVALRAQFDARAQSWSFDFDCELLLDPIEDFDAARLRALLPSAPHVLFINSAFSLHHSPPSSPNYASRTELLELLGGLQPRLLILGEPHSSHASEELGERLAGAWQHFGHVFELIDESVFEPASKLTLKLDFFGRELRDLFGVAEPFRSERHETYLTWLERLTRAGLVPARCIQPSLALPESCSFDASDGLLRLRYRNEVIVAVLAYTAHAMESP